MKSLPTFGAFALLALVWSLDLTQALGAHPLWSGKVVWTGGPGGILAAVLAARLPGSWRVAGFAAATGFALAIAWHGKESFVSSYATDRFAGKLWFYGWMATTAGFGAVAHSVVSVALARRT